MDHFDAESVSLFPDSAVVLCPVPVAEYLEEGGRRVVSMRPGESYSYKHGHVIAVESVHPGGRFSWKNSDEYGAIGFVITTPHGAIYYSGDTEYFEGMIDIGSAWRLEIAILNMSPHLSGEDAIRAVWATRAKVVIPSHFGAYDYIFFGPLKGPRGYDEIKEMICDQTILLQPGEDLPLERGTRRAAGRN
jgi:L-ascorbate metabolism protein UlaG (beta-lactamase superfamily)